MPRKCRYRFYLSVGHAQRCSVLTLGLAHIPYVAVPAHDEAARLPRLVRALDAQGRRVRLTVLFNNCTDASAAVLKRALADAPNVAGRAIIMTLPSPFANAGCARRLALDAARNRAIADGVPVERLALLTTDADAEPAPDWIAANLDALDAGADLVGGRISAFADEEARLGADVRARARRLATLQDRLTRIECAVDPVAHDPWPRHHDTLGASLAIRGAMYARIGGAPVRAASEDVALAQEVRLQGGRVRRCPRVRVAVSARLTGRAQGGMAQTLSDWIEDAAQGRAMSVEAPWLSVARMYERARLRRWFAARGEIADGRLHAPGLSDIADASPSADAFVERLLPLASPPRRTVPLDTAIAWLAGFETGPGWFGSGTAPAHPAAARSVQFARPISSVPNPEVA
ncbi:MAG: glycosyltransferase family A protein [Pseudomonadota bacterium]